MLTKELYQEAAGANNWLPSELELRTYSLREDVKPSAATPSNSTTKTKTAPQKHSRAQIATARRVQQRIEKLRNAKPPCSADMSDDVPF